MARNVRVGVGAVGAGVYAFGTCHTCVALLRSGIPQLWGFRSPGCSVILTDIMSDSQTKAFLEEKGLPWNIHGMLGRIETEGGAPAVSHVKFTMDVASASTGEIIYSDAVMLRVHGVSVGGMNGTGTFAWLELDESSFNGQRRRELWCRLMGYSKITFKN